jgi:ABC-type transport system involved in Fe-S cluster assembly fused permease/ATPase subunit
MEETNITSAVITQGIKVKKKRDWLMYLAIIIMLVGCYLTINETKYCKDPYRYMIDSYIQKEYGGFISYNYATIEIFNNESFLMSFDLIGSKDVATRYRNNTFNSNFSIIKK